MWLWVALVAAGAAAVDCSDAPSESFAVRVEAPAEVAPEAAFGIALALDGASLVVGTALASKVFVYREAAIGEWELEQTVDVPLDGSGRVLALDGDRLLVGTEEGAAVVLERASPEDPWVDAEPVLTVPSLPLDAALASSVALHGDVAVLAAPFEGEEFRGAAYVFERGDSGWQQQARLAVEDGLVGDSLGSVVALLGSDMVLVGAGLADVDGNEDQGAAYLWERDGTGSAWGLSQRLTAVDGQASDFLGFSAAMFQQDDDAVALVGSQTRGVVYAYRRDAASGVWAQEERLTSSTVGDTRFGASIAATSDGRVAIGAYGTESVVILERVSESNEWETVVTVVAESEGSPGFTGAAVALGQGRLAAGMPGANALVLASSADPVVARTLTVAPGIFMAEPHSLARFGTTLSAYGDLLLVSAPADETDAGIGSAALLRYSAERQTWEHEALFKSSVGTQVFNYGAGLAIAPDRAFVGDPDVAGGGRSNVGRVFVYRHNTESGEWLLESELNPIDADQLTEFGTTLALDAQQACVSCRLLVGAPGTSGGLKRPAIHVFDRLEDGSTYTLTQRIEDAGTDIGTRFARALAFARKTFLVGAWSGNDSKGAAYLYGLVDPQDPAVFERKAVLVAPGGEIADRFGMSVALNEGATTALVGAPGVVRDFGSSVGSVYVFTQSAAGNWTFFQEIELVTPLTGQSFLGASVWITGDLMGAGASNVGDRGSLFLLRQSQVTGLWAETVRLVAPEATGSLFGAASTIVRSSQVIIGAPLDNSLLVNGGSLTALELGAVELANKRPVVVLPGRESTYAIRVEVEVSREVADRRMTIVPLDGAQLAGILEAEIDQETRTAVFPTLSLTAAPGTTSLAVVKLNNALEVTTLEVALEVVACADVPGQALAVNPERVDTCACDEGAFVTRAGICEPCPIGFYKSFVGDAACVQCPDGRLATSRVGAVSAEECFCPDGSFAVEDGGECVPCPSGATCSANRVQATAGHWVLSDGDGAPVVIDCKQTSVQRCLGNNTCADGYDSSSVACSLCQKSHGTVGEFCVECPPEAGNAVLIALTIVLGLLAISFLLRTSTSAGADSSSASKVLISYLQVLALLGTFSVEWPRKVASILGLAGALVPTSQQLSFDCAFRMTAYDRLIFGICMPFIVVACVVAFYALKTAVEGWQSTYKERAVSNILFLLHIFHPAIVSACVSVMRCEEYGPAGAFLASDPSIRCDAEHTAYLAVGVVFFLVYGIGLLLLALHVMHKFPHDPMLHFLRAGLDSNAYFWEVVSMAKKLAIMAIGTLIIDSGSLQLLLGQMVILAALYAHMHVQPYRSKLVARMEEVASLVLIVTLSSSITFRANDVPGEARGMFEWIVILINVFTAFSIVSYIVVSVAAQKTESGETRSVAMAKSLLRRMGGSSSTLRGSPPASGQASGRTSIEAMRLSL